MGDARVLLERFLAGDMPEDEIAALEARLDEEPELQRLLGEMAQAAYGEALPAGGTTRISILARHPTLPPPTIDTSIALGDLIGQGGMGVVLQADQLSVGRSVAVKTARKSKHVAALLGEARLTGYLEHPNIVPIHEIAVNDKGRPLVVMKRIEGTVWRETLAETSEPRPLEWHVQILIQVCQALRFAHSRDIIHRDVKPENVMIGSFDDVYLLDWGLAVSLDPKSSFPYLGDQRGVAGTPAYMAPEQLADDAPVGVGVHTDIYQLGASLYHAAVGRPPRKGHKLDAIRSAMTEPLDLPADLPEELAAIIERAMAPEPQARFASMADVRTALVDFLEHRASAVLVERGDEAARASATHHRAGEAKRADQTFFEATFSYRAALETWAENAAARRQLDAVVRQRVTQLLDDGEPAAARRALALSEVDDPKLVAEVEAAIDAAAQAKDRLRDYERGDDRQLGLMTRRYIGLSLGGVWFVLNVLLVTYPPDTPFPLLVVALLCLALSAAVIMRSRTIMLEVRLNRYNATMGMLAQVVHVLMLAVATATERSVEATLTELLLLWSLAAGCVASVVDPRIFITSAAFALAHVACRLDPGNLTYALPGCALTMVVVSHAINVMTARKHAAAAAAESEADDAA